ncbi:hypothetical protein EV421DRAFT_127598 [Armillaria borealis]|uniref:Uncharacterized protein n=1 Tax=Armillaria borealis TaxID=47425 RepID=A0AA39IZC6_9AGAR|nr:hypothetical protein EV421DRAFT_127598 [Armillaria borealis]
MGPQRAITTEKDRQIHRLQVLVQAHTVRTSLIQERLGATQRALNTLQTIHTEELAAERQTSETLRKKLIAYQERARAAEMERDDMRAAVSELVDRVSVSKDFNAWPCGQLRATSLLDPVDLLPAAPSRDQTTVYAAALVESLTTERDTERRAHKRTKKVAKNTITILEAQLALREAELESFLGQPPEDLPNLGEEEEEPEEMSDEEAHRILELNVARQRRIEMETRALHARLEGIRPRPRPPNPIDALNAQIQQLSAQVNFFGAELRQLIESEKIDSAEPPREKDLLEADKDEISMDLAKPLFPTTLGRGSELNANLNHDPLPLPPPPPETNTPLHSPAETDLLRDLQYP